MTFNRRSQLRSMELFKGVISLRLGRGGVCDVSAGFFCTGVDGFAGCVAGVGCEAGVDVFCIGVDGVVGFVAEIGCDTEAEVFCAGVEGLVGCVAGVVCVTLLDGGVVAAIADSA